MKFDVEITFRLRQVTAKNLDDSIQSISRMSRLYVGSELESFHLSVEPTKEESDATKTAEQGVNGGADAFQRDVTPFPGDSPG